MGKNAIQGIADTIKEFAAIKAEREKIMGDIMVNRIKAKDNWFYKMQEEKQRRDMEWQGKQRELGLIQQMIKDEEARRQGGQTTQPAVRTTGGMNDGAQPSTIIPDLVSSPFSTNTPTVGSGEALNSLRKRRDKLLGVSTASTPAGTTTDDEIQATAEGIASGNITPDVSKSVSFRDRTRVNAALQGMGFNVTQALSEWNATQKFLGSMNSEKQVRLRQAISSVSDALSGLEEINAEFARSNLAPLNRAQLAIQANTGNQLAAKYLGQINIIRDELAQVFMGGNSPTDKALDLARETLDKNWSPQQLSTAIGNIRTNLQYRVNAINAASVQGTNEGGGTRYLPKTTTPKTKIERANEIAKQNPKMTKQQIIDMVNQEFAQ